MGACGLGCCSARSDHEEDFWVAPHATAMQFWVTVTGGVNSEPRLFKISGDYEAGLVVWNACGVVCLRLGLHVHVCGCVS